MQQRKEAHKTNSHRKLIAIENSIRESAIVLHLNELASSNPSQLASKEDMKELRELMNEVIPHFYLTINKPDNMIRMQEYDVCLLTRAHFTPVIICKLLGISLGYISNLRKRIYCKISKKQGGAKDFDAFILSIY